MENGPEVPKEGLEAIGIGLIERDMETRKKFGLIGDIVEKKANDDDDVFVAFDPATSTAQHRVEEYFREL
jgi:hypothetical protein